MSAFHRSAQETATSPRSPPIEIVFSFASMSGFFPSQMCSTYSVIPPSCLNSCVRGSLPSARASVSVRVRPALRYACSSNLRRRRGVGRIGVRGRDGGAARATAGGSAPRSECRPVKGARALKDLHVGAEGDGRPRARGLGHALLELRPAHLARRFPRGELHRVHVPVTAHLRVQVLAQRVDHRDADAVQAGGDLVPGVAELAAGVENGEYRLERRPPRLRVHVTRDPAPVVSDAHRPVGAQRHVDARGVAGERLVDRVVDHLEDEMVQPPAPRRADVHPRPLAHRLEPFEHGDLLRTVCPTRRGGGGAQARAGGDGARGGAYHAHVRSRTRAPRARAPRQQRQQRERHD